MTTSYNAGSNDASLLQLPFELRIAVYTHIFKGLQFRTRICGCSAPRSCHKWIFENPPNSPLAIVFTSKQIRQESQAIFYHVARFRLTHFEWQQDADGDPRLPLIHRSFGLIERAFTYASSFWEQFSFSLDTAFTRFSQVYSSLQELTIDCRMLQEGLGQEHEWVRGDWASWHNSVPFKLNLRLHGQIDVPNVRYLKQGVDLDLFIEFRQPKTRVTIMNYTSSYCRLPPNPRLSHRREWMRGVETALGIVHYSIQDVEVIQK